MNKLREVIYGFQLRKSESKLNDFIEETKRRASEGRHIALAIRLQREPIAPLDYIRDFDRDEFRVRLTAVEENGDTPIRRSTKNLLVEVSPRQAGKAMKALMQAEKDAKQGKPTAFQITGQWLEDISGIGRAVGNFSKMARYRDRFQNLFSDSPNVQLDIVEVDDNGRVVPFIEFK